MEESKRVRERDQSVLYTEKTFEHVSELALPFPASGSFRFIQNPIRRSRGKWKRVEAGAMGPLA